MFTNRVTMQHKNVAKREVPERRKRKTRHALQIFSLFSMSFFSFFFFLFTSTVAKAAKEFIMSSSVGSVALTLDEN